MKETATGYGENGYTLWSVCVRSIGCRKVGVEQLKALHAEVGDTAAEGSVGALEGELKGADLLEGFIAGHQAYVRTKGLDEAAVDIEARLAVVALDGDVLVRAGLQGVAEGEEVAIADEAEIATMSRPPR